MPSSGSATVIDSLVILLSLDTTKFTDQQKKALQSLRATKEGAASTAKELEARGGQAALFFDKLSSSALKFATLGIAGLGLSALTQYTKQTVETGAATGRMATTIGISARELSVWQNAVKQLGGDVNSVGPSMQSLSQELQSFALTGQSSILPFLRAMHVELTNSDGSLKTVTQLYEDFHNKFSKMSPQQANFYGSALGLNQDLINLLRSSDTEFQKYLENARKVTVITDAQTGKFQKLQSAWENLDSAIKASGAGVIEDLAPGLTALAKKLTDIIVDATEETNKMRDFENRAGPVSVAIPPVSSSSSSSSGSSYSSPPASQGGGLTLFDLVQHDENSSGKIDSPAGAIGKNQIMPDTARQYGFDPSRLREPAYNDMVARAIESDLNARYKGDVDAITIAYHNGSGAADRWLASGKNESQFGPQTRAYLARERAAVGGAGRTTSTTTVGTLIIQVPAGTPRAIAGDIHKELVNQGNKGPQ